jgi:hypothetical protein
MAAARARSAENDDGDASADTAVLTDCLSSKLGQMLPIRYSDCCGRGCVGRMDANVRVSEEEEEEEEEEERARWPSNAPLTSLDST